MSTQPDRRERKTYEADLRSVDIVTTPRLIAFLGGANPATVLKQIHYWAEYHKTGWFEASSWDLADLTGLSPDQVRREVKKLVDAGHVEKENRSTNRGEQKCRYRVVLDLAEVSNRSVSAHGGSAGPRHGDIAGRKPGDSAGPSTKKIRTEEIDLSPLAGGHDGQLFDAGTPEPVKTFDEDFEAWWTLYLAERHDTSVPVGSKADTKKKFAARAAEKGTPALFAYLANYSAARTVAAERFSGPAPLMHAVRFLNNAWEDWQEPVDSADDHRVANWKFACEKAVAGTAEAPVASMPAPDPIKAAFAIAEETFYASRNEHRPGPAWLAALADHPQIADVVRRCWEEFGRNREGRWFVFRDAWQAVHGNPAAVLEGAA